LITKLGTGKFFLNYGPVQMVISAFKKEEPLEQAIIDAADYAKELLKILSANLTEAKSLINTLNGNKKFPKVLEQMIEAVSSTGDNSLTPMAAVAGTFADSVADFLVSKGASKVIVNNGGDMALRLESGEKTRIGIISGINNSTYSYVYNLKAKDGIGGIATSGLGGRSLTKGIASAVTVFGQNCRVVDACATLIANYTFRDSPGIVRMPAEKVDPDTDIKGQLVTVEIRPELEQEIFKEAISNGLDKAKMLLDREVIAGVIIFAGPYMSVLPKSLINRMAPRINLLKGAEVNYGQRA